MFDRVINTSLISGIINVTTNKLLIPIPSLTESHVFKNTPGHILTYVAGLKKNSK